MDISPDPTKAERHSQYVGALEAELRAVSEATSYIGDEDGRASRVKDIKAELAKAKGGTETAVAPGVK
jgi:uncharacterized protein YpuA (DUF1002 family)